MVALLSRRKQAEPTCCGHHYHFRSGYADPTGLACRTAWVCCHCGTREPGGGPAPDSPGGGCATPIDPAESITAWLNTPPLLRPRPRRGT